MEFHLRRGYPDVRTFWDIMVQVINPNLYVVVTAQLTVLHRRVVLICALGSTHLAHQDTPTFQM